MSLMGLKSEGATMHRIIARATLLVGGILTSCAAGQQVTVERIIGDGDPLPNGRTYMGAGFPAINGEWIVFRAGTNDGNAVCRYHLPTGTMEVMADNTTRSPTYPSFMFKSFWNPSVSPGGRVVTSAAAQLFTNEYEGVYEMTPGGAQTIIDELSPPVRSPIHQVNDGVGVIFRDKGYAGEPVAFADYSGVFRWVAQRGQPAPGGGTYFEMELPSMAGGLASFNARVSPSANRSAFAWRAATGQAELIATEGDPIPGSPHTMLVGLESDSDGANVVFGARGGAFPNYYHALLVWDGASIENAVATGDPMPGSGGEVFDQVHSPSIDAGNVAFMGSGGGMWGIYARHNGEIVRILDSSMTFNNQAPYNARMKYRCISGNQVVFGLTLGSGFGEDAIYLATIESTCYPDCDRNGMLDVFDFLCFQDAFVAGDPYADCDGNTVLDVFDFLCYQDAFVAGCP
jgi:hypothetical protein